MAEEIPRKEIWHLADLLSRSDELLEAILKELRGIREVRPPAAPPVVPPGVPPIIPPIAPPAAPPLPMPSVLITFPPEGGWKTVAKGTVTMNLLSGEVTLPDGKKEHTSASLTAHRIDYARSILVECNRDVTISLGAKGKYSVDAFEYIPLPNQEFQFVTIETTESTKIRVWASTHPYGIPQKVSSRVLPFRGAAREYQARFYWANMRSIPAESYYVYEEVYEVPEGKRLVVEYVMVSSDVRGIPQMLELFDYDGTTYYRFGGSWFHTQHELILNYPMTAGHTLCIQRRNFDETARYIWVTIHGFEEPA